MADVQVTSATLQDGILTVTGSGFTRTTTRLYINGVETAFEVGDDFDGTEITVTEGLPPEGTKTIRVWAIKGSIESDHVKAERPTPAPTEDQASDNAGQSAEGGEAGSGAAFDPGGDVHPQGYKTETWNETPGDLVEDDLKTMSDVDPAQLAKAGTAGAEAKQDFEQPGAEGREGALQPGEHLPGADFRSRIQGTFAGDLNMDPRQPYPTGNPPDPREEYYRINGYYPSDQDETQLNQKGADRDRTRP